MNEDHPIYKAIDRGGGQTCDIPGVLRELDAAGYAIVPKAAFAAQQDGAWQPIETAPKDGTRVWLFEEKPIRGMSVARWVGAPHDVWIADRGNYIRRATRWQPLPAPPAS